MCTLIYVHVEQKSVSRRNLRRGQSLGEKNIIRVYILVINLLEACDTDFYILIACAGLIA